MKKSPMPFGWYYVTHVALSLPYVCYNFLTSDLASKYTMVFSNVPGSRAEWFITGKRVISYGFSIPLGKTVPMGWAAISHVDNLKVSVTSDKASVQDMDWLVRQFETNLDDFMESKEWRKWNPARTKEI